MTDWTGDIDLFVDSLNLADVVFVQTDHPIGNLMRLLEGIEYNHVTLYAGDGNVMHASPADGIETCIQTADLRELVEAAGATALHARGMSDPRLARQVVAKALELRDHGPRFGFNDLVLMPAAIDYVKRHFADMKSDDVIKEEWELEVLVFDTLSIEGRQRLTCSEFVWRCFLSVTEWDIAPAIRSWEPLELPTSNDFQAKQAMLTDDLDAIGELSSREMYELLPHLFGNWLDDSLPDVERLNIIVAAFRELLVNRMSRKPEHAPRPKAPDSLSDHEANLVSPGDLFRTSHFLDNRIGWRQP